MARANSKENILDAAESIVLESGAVHMTLDAVSVRAKISKGGLIYHFPTKEALLEAMLARLSEKFDQLREKARQKLPQDENNELAVEISMLMGISGKEQRLGAALLAVVANQPDLADVFRKKSRKRFFNQIAQPDEFERSAILYFAAIGAYFHKLLNMSILNTDQWKRIREEMLRLAAHRKDI